MGEKESMSLDVPPLALTVIPILRTKSPRLSFFFGRDEMNDETSSERGNKRYTTTNVRTLLWVVVVERLTVDRKKKIVASKLLLTPASEFFSPQFVDGCS